MSVVSCSVLLSVWSVCLNMWHIFTHFSCIFCQGVQTRGLLRSLQWITEFILCVCVCVWVFVCVCGAIQNCAFSRLAPQKGTGWAKNNPDQRNRKKKNKSPINTSFPLGLFSAVVLVVGFVYLMSFLDCESTPPLSNMFPRCSYGMTGNKMLT